MMEIVYLQSFEQVYLRNNKSSGDKNIRCFPNCCDNGNKHIDKGFCGESINIRLSIDKNLSIDISDKIVLVGFLQDIKSFEEDNHIDSVLEYIYDEHQSSNMHFFTGIEKTRVESSSKIIIDYSFNSNPKRWTYNWRSNRFTRSHHSFIVTVLFQSLDKYEMIGQAYSPLFLLTSCKRRQEYCNVEGIKSIDSINSNNSEKSDNELSTDCETVSYLSKKTKNNSYLNNEVNFRYSNDLMDEIKKKIDELTDKISDE